MPNMPNTPNTPNTPRPLFTQPSPAAARLEVLRQHFPECLETAQDGTLRINPHKLQMAFNPAAVQVEEDGYELRWAGKREAYHSAFVPPRKVLHPLPEASKNWGSTQNLLLQGDNIDALRLLRQSYFGQVKLIYIDPPYNTQSDAFIYRDNFTQKQEQVLEQLGYSKENSEYIKNIYGARTHSGWLSFMYPRLLLAKDMLRDDGVIFISIDDNEQAQLKLLCDEVFGQDNFVANFLWKKKSTTSNVVGAEVSSIYDYQICYKKTDLATIKTRVRSKETRSQPFQDETGKYRLVSIEKKDAGGYKRDSMKFPILGIRPRQGKRWQIGEAKAKELEEKNRFIFDGEKIQLKIYDFEEKDTYSARPNIFFDDCGNNESAEIHVNKNLFGVSELFSSPKPHELIEHIADLVCNDDDLIMDFFAGSGTTAEAVMRLNAEDGGQRRFILVQIPQPIDAKKQKEAHQFVQTTLGKAEPTIFDITAERIRRAGQKVSDECAAAGKPAPDVGFQVYAIDDDCGGLLLGKNLGNNLGNNLGKNLADAEQGDLLSLQQSIHTPQADDIPRVLANLLLAEGLPLTAHIHTVRPHCLYWAQDARADAGAGTGTLLVLQGIKLMELADELDALEAQGKPVTHCCIFTPWVQDDGLLHGIKTLLEDRGLGAERLRLRG